MTRRTEKWYLNLTARAPQGTLALCPSSGLSGQSFLSSYLVGKSYPVWRLVISPGRISPTDNNTPSHVPSSACDLGNPNNDVLYRATGVVPPYEQAFATTSTTSAKTLIHPDTCSLEPVQYQFQPSGSAANPPPLPNFPGNPGSFSLLPDNNSVTNPNIPIERIVWFTNPAGRGSGLGTGYLDYDRIFYYRQTAAGGPPVELGGDEYLVVGPRPTTFIGNIAAYTWTGTSSSGEPEPEPNPATGNTPGTYGWPSPQKITLGSQSSTFGSPEVSWTGTTNNSNRYPVSGQQIKPAWAMVVAADPPPQTSWPKATLVAPYGIGISISEPLPSGSSGGSYYGQPTSSYVNRGTGLYDTYSENGAGLGPGGKIPHGAIETQHPAIGSAPVGMPLVDESLLTSQTTLNYKTVFLQRLANPSAPFDPLVNPYRTVDWMPIDLTVFNGGDPVPPAAALQRVNLAANGSNWDPDDPNPGFQVNSRLPFFFRTRERGGWAQVNGASTQNPPNLWTQYQPSSAPPSRSQLLSPQSNSQNVVFCCDLLHTLGYLNSSYQGPTTGSGAAFAPGCLKAQGLFSAPDYCGDPPGPFPWLNINYRPFASPTELMQVPASSPARLLFEYNLAYNSVGMPTVPGGSTASPFNSCYGYYAYSAVNSAGTQPQPGWGAIPVTSRTFRVATLRALRRTPYSAAPRAALQSYPHLLNFFDSVDSPAPPVFGMASPGPPVYGAKLYRLFDFVGVPSPFVGTEVLANPTYATENTTSPTHLFHPPFNRIPTYREPGKVNLNTIYGNTASRSDVWTGLMNYLPQTFPPTSSPTWPDTSSGNSWQSVWQSRQAYASAGGSIFSINPASPTRFGRPFRSSFCGSLSAFLPPQYQQQSNQYQPSYQVDSTLFGSSLVNIAARLPDRSTRH